MTNSHLMRLMATAIAINRANAALTPAASTPDPIHERRTTAESAQGHG